MNFYKFLRKENSVKGIRNQNQKIHPKRKIPTVAKLAIQEYAECPQYINLLPTIKRGGRRREEGGEKGENKKKGEGKQRSHVHGKQQFYI